MSISRVKPVLFIAILPFLANMVFAQTQSLKAYLPLNLQAPETAKIIALANRVGELAGVKFVFYDHFSAERAKVELLNGELDAAFGIADSLYQDAAPDLVMVKEPFLTAYHRVVSLEPFNYVDMQSLRGLSVIALRGTVSAELLGREKTLKFVEAIDWRNGFEMLRAGRGKLLIVHESVIEAELSATKANQKTNFFVSPIPFVQVRNMIWLAKKNNNLAIKLEAALVMLKRSGEYDRILGSRDSRNP